MIITVAAQKGGVSKTSTAAAMAQGLAYKGKKTLLIDADAQRGASLIYGADSNRPGLYELITGKAKAKDIVQTTTAGNIIPGSGLLDRLDIELNNQPGRDSLLKAGIAPLLGDYDCIIIDTAPGLGTCLIQALTAADYAIIPLVCDPQGLEGLHQITATIEQVKTYCNPDLKIAAVLLTQYQGRATLTKQYEALITEQCEAMGIPIAGTRIRRGIAIQEAQAMRANLFEYAPASNPAADYMAFIQELKFLKIKG